MFRWCCLGILLVLTLGGCREKAAPARRVTVMAAASLADAFRDAAGGFEAAEGVRVEFSFAGSNQLRIQLEHGAPADVFASADRVQMDAAAAVVDAASVRVLAHNRLAVIVPKDNPAHIGGLQDLARAGVKIVVADQAVPVGNYTRKMLGAAAKDPKLGDAFVAAFDGNTVSREENVAAVVTKVALGEADAGIAYVSDAAGGNAGKIAVVPVPGGLDQRADYMIAVTRSSRDPKLAAAFVKYMVSGAGAGSMKARGFEAAGAGAP